MLDTRRVADREKSAWVLRWLCWRNRLIASPALQRWAMRNPLTRFKARGHARALFDLTAGFVYSQVTAALVESGLVERLLDDALTLDEAARAAGLSRDGAYTLLTAAASLQLTTFAAGRWTLAERGAALAGTPGLADMIRHHRLFYADLADPLALLRGEGDPQLARLWDYRAGADPEDAETYSRLMAATQPLVAAQALAAYDFGRHCRLLDIGGGHGRFLAAVRENHPGLELGLMDRLEVLASFPAKDFKPTLHPGSFLDDPLPRGYDLHSLVRVLHDHDDAPAQRLLDASRAALEPGGKLIIVEPMASLGSAPEGHAYFGFYLTAMRSGRSREVTEIRAMLANAGFRRSRLIRTPLPLVARCIVADA